MAEDSKKKRKTLTVPVDEVPRKEPIEISSSAEEIKIEGKVEEEGGSQVLQYEESHQKEEPLEEKKETLPEVLSLDNLNEEEEDIPIRISIDTEQLLKTDDSIDIKLTELEEIGGGGLEEFHDKEHKEEDERLIGESGTKTKVEETKELKPRKIIILDKKQKKIATQVEQEESKIFEEPREKSSTETIKEEIKKEDLNDEISVEIDFEVPQRQEETEELSEIEEVNLSVESVKLPKVISIPPDEVPRKVSDEIPHKEVKVVPPPPPSPPTKKEPPQLDNVLQPVEKIAGVEEVKGAEEREWLGEEVGETQRLEKPQRPWWEEIFNDDYLRVQPKLTEWQIKQKAAFIERSLEIQPGGMILDLACGTGEFTVEMAIRGYQMVGLDLSIPMLGQAAELAQQKGQKINFVHGDMREMDFESVFDGVFCIGSSFGYFDEETNLKVLRDIYKSLKLRGTFLLEVVNRDYVIQEQPNNLWFEGEGCVCMEESYFNFINSRLYVKRTLIIDDGRQVVHNYNIRLYTLHELGKMLHEVGFKVLEISGHIHTPGVFMGSHSPYIIILAEKEKRGASK